MTQLAVQTTTVEVQAVSFDKDLCQRWVSFLDCGPRTVQAYGKAVHQFLDWLRINAISQPERSDILRYRDSLAETHKPTTVRLYITAVRLFFQWLESEDLYRNIANHVKGPKSTPGFRKDPLTSRQTRNILDHIDTKSERGARDYAMISIMAVTGLRCTSIVNADVEDLRPYGDTLVLHYRGKGHSEKDLLVKIPGPVEDAIQAYLSLRGNVSGKAPLFASLDHREKGGRMTTRSVSRIAKARMKDVGLNSDRLTAHSLRHGCATMALSNGSSLQEVMQTLSHANISTTLIYSHNLQRLSNTTEERVCNSIFN